MQGRALRSWRAWAQQRADSLQAMRRGLGSLMCLLLMGLCECLQELQDGNGVAGLDRHVPVDGCMSEGCVSAGEQHAYQGFQPLVCSRAVFCSVLAGMR